MNSFVSSIIGFGIGASVGAGIMKYIYDKKFNAELENMVIEEVEAYKKDHPCACDGNCKKKETEDKVEDAEKPLNKNDIPKEVIESAAQMRKVIKESKTNYSKIVRKEGYDMKDKSNPFMVDSDVFFNPDVLPDYERIKAYYDTENGEVFLESGGEYLNDTDYSVGYINLEHFEKDHDDIIYIQNDSEKIIYEIIADDVVI